MVTFKLKETDIGLDVEGLLPEVIRGKSTEEIERIKIFYGNRKVDVGDFFDVSNDGENMVFEGDLTRIKRIGAFLRDGEIVIRGNAGMYTGAFMRGGKIVVEGDVGHFSALNMKGGEMVVRGNAGDCLGASYRGDWRGMSSGKIFVSGNAGKEVGSHMRGGIIIIRGYTDSYCGVKMTGGIIFANKANKRAGASMRGGSIIINETPELLPGFFFEGKMRPNIEEELLEGEYSVFSGDHAEKGAKGKMYVREFSEFEY